MAGIRVRPTITEGRNTAIDFAKMRDLRLMRRCQSSCDGWKMDNAKINALVNKPVSLSKRLPMLPALSLPKEREDGQHIKAIELYYLSISIKTFT